MPIKHQLYSQDEWALATVRDLWPLQFWVHQVPSALLQHHFHVFQSNAEVNLDVSEYSSNAIVPCYIFSVSINFSHALATDGVLYNQDYELPKSSLQTSKIQKYNFENKNRQRRHSFDIPISQELKWRETRNETINLMFVWKTDTLYDNISPQYKIIWLLTGYQW